MKSFGPASENKQYSYNNPTYLGSFGITSYMINEVDFNQLERKARHALIDGDDRAALLYAGKAAIEYGVAGLVLYVDTYIKILSEPSSENQIIEQEVIKLLAYVNFAHHMVMDKKENKALKSMQLVYFDENFESHSYWKEREVKLLSFIKNIELAKNESQDMADALINECQDADKYEQSKSNSY